MSPLLFGNIAWIMYVCHNIYFTRTLVASPLIGYHLVSHIFLIGDKKEYTFFNKFCDSVTMQSRNI